MAENERDEALANEAAALDRQLVSYVVDKLAASRLAGDIALSDTVRQQVEAAFADVVQGQGAAIGAAIAARSQSLIDALDTHTQALNRAISARPDQGPSPRSQMRHERFDPTEGEEPDDLADTRQRPRGAPASPTPTRLVDRFGWVMPFAAGVLVAAVAAGLVWAMLPRQPDGTAACALIARTRADLGDIVSQLGQTVETEEFQRALPEGDATGATDPANPPELSARLASVLNDAHQQVRTIAQRSSLTCEPAR